MKFFHTFRVRLLVILTILLITTLGVQFSINYTMESQNKKLRETREQALVAGIALGFKSFTSDDRLIDFATRGGEPFFDENVIERIQDIIIINNRWQINDSLNPDYLPTENAAGELIKVNLMDVRDLPPLVNAYRLGEDRNKFPNNIRKREIEGNNSEAEAHAIPIETADDGRWYVMVLLKNDASATAWRAAEPLVYTLTVLLLSTIITIFLVWRFTRPLANISEAAKKVADGNLSVRVPEYGRSDEMGKLASRFNEMTAELEKKSELEKQLKEAEKSAVVGRLGSAIAHEIRNPLNYINLTLDHLRVKFKPEEAEKKETFDKLTSQLKSEVARINRQITDFLSYSRPPKLQLDSISIHKVVEDSLRIVEAQAAEQNIEVSFQEETNLPDIKGDAEFLRSVFNNLFINAVQAMEATGGKLDIKISAESEYVRVDIEDTGGGIPAENIEKIFEPYFSTKETGTGLGLAIVKKVIDDHSGEITVESVQAKGTHFTVKLPIAESAV